MKLAIILSGRIQDDESQYLNIMNIFVKEHEVDFFICYPKETNIEIVNWVTEKYKPKKILENDENYFNADKYEKGYWNNRHRVMSMFLNRYKLSECFKDYIQETGREYEIVIAMRMDLCFTDLEFDITTLCEPINRNELCIPNPGYDHGGMNDQIAIGNTEQIIQYLDLYGTLFEILEKGIYLQPENLLFHYLHYWCNVSFYRFETPYEIKRYVYESSQMANV